MSAALDQRVLRLEEDGKELRADVRHLIDSLAEQSRASAVLAEKVGGLTEKVGGLTERVGGLAQQVVELSQRVVELSRQPGVCQAQPAATPQLATTAGVGLGGGATAWGLLELLQRLLP